MTERSPTEKKACVRPGLCDEASFEHRLVIRFFKSDLILDAERSKESNQL